MSNTEGQPIVSSSPIDRYSNLGRIIDPRYPTHRWLFAFATATALVVGAAALVTGEETGAALVRAVLAGLTVGVTWVVGREIDPDHPLSAFVGAGLALVAFLVWGASDLVAIAGLILGLRVVNRTTGLGLMRGDGIVVAIVTGIVAFTGNWIISLVLLIALVMDGLLPKPNRPDNWIYAGIAAVATVIGAVLSQQPLIFNPTFDPLLLIAAVAVTIGYVLTVRTVPETPLSVGDRTGEPLHRSRVIAAQLLALAAALGTLLVTGTAGVIALSTLWAAMLGMVAWQGVLLVRRRN